MNVSFLPVSEGLPGGFSIARTGKGAPSVWLAIKDSSVSGGYVLAQTSTDRTDYRFPLAIYNSLMVFNLHTTVRFKAISGEVDRAAGLVVRFIDPDNYYVVRANALEDNVNFYRVVDGVRRENKGESVKVTAGMWHTLGISAVGDKFTISFNDETLFTASDRALSKAGKVALWTKADSVTHFDALTIRVLA